MSQTIGIPPDNRHKAGALVTHEDKATLFGPVGASVPPAARLADTAEVLATARDLSVRAAATSRSSSDRPSTAFDRPTAAFDRPTSPGDRPTAAFDRPTSPGDRPTTASERPKTQSKFPEMATRRDFRLAPSGGR
jgi:hypothetical protein